MAKHCKDVVAAICAALLTTIFLKQLLKDYLVYVVTD